MTYDTLASLFNSAIDVLFDSFGAEWLVNWGIDNEMTDEQIINWLIEDEELVAKLRKENENDTH